MFTSTQHTSSTRGISLVELLIAASLLTIAFGAFIGLFLRQSEATRTAQLESVAAKIALNGYELVRNKRDNHARCVEPGITDCPYIGDWRTNLTQGSGIPAGGPVTYELDETAVDLLLPNAQLEQISGTPSTLCAAQGDPRFVGRFRPCEPGDTALRGNFTRTVTLTEVRPDIMQVDIRVTWQGGRTFEVSGLLAYDQT